MAYAYTQQSWNTPRFVGFCAALAINAILVIGLMSALRLPDTIDAPPPLMLVPYDEPETPLPPPQTPPEVQPGFARPDIGPMPDFDVPLANDAPAGEFPTYWPPDTGPGQGATTPVVTQLQVDPAFFVRPPYPPRSVALEEEGVVHLLIRVTADGRVADVQISRSSGFHRLDNAAVKTVRSKWRFRPRMQDGVAVEGHGTYAVRFELK